MPQGLGFGGAGGQKFNFMNMVMWHIKLKGMSSRPGYTEKFYPIDGWLRMGLLPPPLGNFADISYVVEN